MYAPSLCLSMKIEEIFFSSHGIRATFPACHFSSSLLVGLLSVSSTRRIVNFEDTSSGHVSLRSHELTVQSILATHLVTVSHSSHINSSYSQFQRHILRLCLTPVTSTRRTVNLGNTSYGHVSLLSHQLDI